MRVLGIETSCDESAAAVIEENYRVLSNVVSTQLMHSRYGGVVPEIASRAHLRSILPVIRSALQEAGIGLEGIDAIAVTRGPGLIGSLLVGLGVAKGIAYSLGVDILGVNHLEGHIFANFIENPKIPSPFVCLIISGGHTELFFVPELGEYKLLGQTRDDAAGEAFDKVAVMLGLGYPGGKKIDQLAAEGNPHYHQFPRAWLDDGFDFSFSGLKTAVLNYLEKLGPKRVQERIKDICASFQAAVIDVLVERCLRAAEEMDTERILLAGGVAANSLLRRRLSLKGERDGLQVHYPPPPLCTDNGAMVAACGLFYIERGFKDGLDLRAEATSKLGEGKC